MKSVAKFSLLLLLLSASLANAHDARPNYVQITETTPNTFAVMWKVPASVPGAALPYPTLPEGCVAEQQPTWQSAGAEFVVAICGDIMTLPGLPRVPAANNIRLDANGLVEGLF